MTGPRRIPTAELLVHYCTDGDGVLMRRDRQALIFLGKCEICDGEGRNCQILGGPVCAECLEALQ